MKSNKILVYLVIALIAVNIALLSFLWYQHFSRRPQDLPMQAYEFLTRELNLTPQQQEQYAAMRQKHFELTRRINEQNHALRDSLFNQVKSTKATPTEINQLLKQISANQQQIDSATFYHFRDVRAILTPQQQNKFDQILNDVLHRMANPGPRGPGPGRDGPDSRPGPPPPGPDGQGPPPGGPPAAN